MVFPEMLSECNTYYASPIGTLEIVGDGHAVTAVNFIEKEQQPANSNPLLEECVKQLDEYFFGTRKSFTVPLAPHGTPFQKQVWNELLLIPFGKTASYLDIARAMKNEKSVRAVGAANGANPIAIIIPCHRVIGADGSLTGYAGGIERKEWLLRHEGVDTAANQMTIFDRGANI